MNRDGNCEWGNRLDRIGEHSSTYWMDYLERNAASLLSIPWDIDYQLEEEVRGAIAKSIAEFQKGESSEGRHLIGTARAYSERRGDPLYLEATILFIKEEQRHARELRRYMSARGIPMARYSWPDRIFRGLRHLGGLEVSICVLITAEIIAQTYYPALQKATNDPVLIRICDQIIADEEEHIQIQTERIADLRNEAGVVRSAVSIVLQRVLFFGTVFVVWIQHWKVFKRGGFSFRAFHKDCWRNYWNAERKVMRPRFRILKTVFSKTH